MKSGSPPPITAEAPPSDAKVIGEKLRLRRKRKRLSLKDVAEKSGLSIGMLSLVERGLTMPSVRSMRTICDALEMPVRWLFDGMSSDNAHETGVVVRKAERRSLSYANSGLHKELLTPDSQAHLQMFRFVMQPGINSGDAYNNAPGGKCGVVLSGSLGLELDGREFTIESGDSFAFDATQKVRFWTIGSEVCEVLWVVTPPTV